MSEEEYKIKVFGRKINKEKEGYTDVDSDGVARPVLKIPSDIPKGRRRLTAVYSDERRKTHAQSLARALVIYGSKAYIHCPTIYHFIQDEDITLKANIFANNRPVPGGYAIFKIQNKTVSTSRLPVTLGHVEETYSIPVHVDKTYQCPYEGSEHYKISEARGEGVILVYREEKTPLIVEVLRLITNEHEHVKLVARVYHKNHGKVVNFPDDIPESGNITFFIDGEKVTYDGVSAIPISKSGFATIPIVADYGIGVHEITAVYEPDTEELKLKYNTTCGANTLFIGNDTNKPVLTQTGLNCGVRGEEYMFEFKSSRKLSGLVRIYIDGSTINGSECYQNGDITIFGDTLPLYEQEVMDKNSFTFTIIIPNNRWVTQDGIWGYAGNHNMLIQYIEYDDELGDMEYWYTWKDFYIQIDTKVYVEDKFIDNTSDNGKYTGNNMYIKENGEIVHYKPSESEMDKSLSIGNPLKIYVRDVDTNDPIPNGTVKVKIKSRKKNEE